MWTSPNTSSNDLRIFEHERDELYGRTLELSTERIMIRGRFTQQIAHSVQWNFREISVIRGLAPNIWPICYFWPRVAKISQCALLTELTAHGFSRVRMRAMTRSVPTAFSDLHNGENISRQYISWTSLRSREQKTLRMTKYDFFVCANLQKSNRKWSQREKKKIRTRKQTTALSTKIFKISSYFECVSSFMPKYNYI